MGKNVEAGGAFVRLFTDKSPMIRGLKSARKDFDSWAAGIGAAGAKLAAVGAAGAGIRIASFADLTRDAIGDLVDQYLDGDLVVSL